MDDGEDGADEAGLGDSDDDDNEDTVNFLTGFLLPPLLVFGVDLAAAALALDLAASEAPVCLRTLRDDRPPSPCRLAFLAFKNNQNGNDASSNPHESNVSSKAHRENQKN